MSGNARSRKRKPDQTFKYVQKDNEEKEDEVDVVEKEDGADQKQDALKPTKDSKEAKETTSSGGGGGASDSENSTTEPASKKNNVKSPDLLNEEGADKSKSNESSTKTDGFGFLSEADRKLMETDMIEFLKRFAPKYYVPVYKTWTIPKQAAS